MEPDKRPLSPHIGIYRFTITMVMSIAHRISGVIAYFGTVLLVIAFSFAAYGSDEYDTVQSLMRGPVGLFFTAGYVWAISLHGLGGLRHLLWDTGRGLDKPVASFLGWITLIGSVVVAALVMLLLN